MLASRLKICIARESGHIHIRHGPADLRMKPYSDLLNFFERSEPCLCLSCFCKALHVQCPQYILLRRHPHYADQPQITSPFQQLGPFEPTQELVTYSTLHEEIGQSRKKSCS